MVPAHGESLRDFATQSEPWFRQNLQMLVEHPTVSPGARSRDAIVSGAKAAAELMRACGATAELVECSGTPSVLGRFAARSSGAQSGSASPRFRVIVYNHLDVQPADPKGWQQADPFRFEVHPHPERDFIYRGRGTTDDKGPALCAVRAAMWAQQQGLPIEVLCLWETEEEIGSPNFQEVVRARRSVLELADCVIVSDTIWPSDAQPAIGVGLRGSLQAVMRLKTGTKDVHSGLTGGVARNPVRELCALATAIDRAKFWHEGVTPPTAEELEGFGRAGFDTEYFKRAHDLLRLETEVPLEMMLRLWTRPTFEVHGLVGGYAGDGVKTIVPHEAELKTSFRLVGGQDPIAVGKRLESFVRDCNPDVDVEVTGFLEPYEGSKSGPVHAAIAQALTIACDREPVLVREGGSIGAVPILARELGLPVHFLPLSLPEHGYHAPNECFDWKQARVGIEAFGHVFSLLAGPA